MKTYSQLVFGRKGMLFEGIDQGFDPSAEQEGKVQYAMDIDFDNQTLKKRNGYNKHTQYGGASVMAISRIDFEESNDSLATLVGDGTIKYTTGI